MGCARVHDFISGATITLVTPDADQSTDPDRIDILHANARARAVMAQHMKALQDLQARQQSACVAH